MQHNLRLSRLIPFILFPLTPACGTQFAGTNTSGDTNPVAPNTDQNTSTQNTSDSNATTLQTTVLASTGVTRVARESWVWVYTNWVTSLTAIASNPNSFTHISPTFYSLNYNYTSGVAYYANCPVSTAAVCSGQGSNNFGGMTTQQFTARVTAAGMATVPAIYAGSANSGTDIGVQNILNNPQGAGQNFITAMVAEAVTNHYAGYNLDWEMGSAVGSAYADRFVTFINNFKQALAPHGMSLSIDVVVSNINGTWCSGNDGYADFSKLAKSSIDRVIIEDYTPDLGAASNTCEAAVLSSTSPASCPLNSSGSDVNAMGLYNFMCSNLPASMIVIGLESYSTGTNPIAGAAVASMQTYGFNNVAIWPQVEGTYPFLSGKGFVATHGDWYSVLAGFLGR